MKWGETTLHPFEEVGLPSRKEAEFLMKVERKREEASSYDVVLAGVRGLSRILEIDNALIREVKRHFEESVGGSILDGAGGATFRKTWSRQNQGRVDLKIQRQRQMVWPTQEGLGR